MYRAGAVLVLREALSLRGRMSRAEYLRYYVGIFAVAVAIKAVTLTPIGDVAGLIGAPLVCISLLAASVRRLHDTNRSGSLLWLGLIPVVGAICLLAALFEAGSPGVNRFGPPSTRGDASGFPTSLARRTYVDDVGNVLRSEIIDAQGNVVRLEP